MKRTLLGVIAITLALAPIGGFVLAVSHPTGLPDLVIVGEGGVLDKVTNVLFTVLLSVAAIFIIIAGYQYVTATGDPEKLTKARQSLIYAIVGVIIAFGARGVVKLIESILVPDAAASIFDFTRRYFS